MGTILEITRRSLHRRLHDSSMARWPKLTDLRLRDRSGFAYVDGVLADGDVVHLCRPRHLGSG